MRESMQSCRPGREPGQDAGEGSEPDEGSEETEPHEAAALVLQKPPASICDDGEKSKENHPIEERGNRTNGEGKERRPDSWVLGPAPVRRDDKDEEGQDDGLEVDELPKNELIGTTASARQARIAGVRG